MRHTDINEGDTLKLKPSHRYGPDVSRIQTVTAVRCLHGYKTPWIYTQDGAFRPSDFAGKVAS